MLARFPGRNADLGTVGGVEVHPGGMCHGLTSYMAEFFFPCSANDCARLWRGLRLVLEQENRKGCFIML